MQRHTGLMDRALFLALSKVVRVLPNRPKKFRDVVAYRAAALRSVGTAVVAVGNGVRLEVNLEDWTHRLYALGEVDGARISWLAHLTPPSGTFVDVGANIGLYACSMARHLAGSGSVFAVEPFPPSVRRLERNVALNQLTNIEVVEAAASDVTGTSSLFEPPSRGPASSGHLRIVDPGDWSQVGTTPTIRLDDLLSGRDIDSIKIDVEGHELEVLAGLQSVLDRCRPTLLCEAIVPEVMDGLRRLSDVRDYSAFQDDGRGKVIPANGTPGDVLMIPDERTAEAAYLRPKGRG